MRTLGFVLVSLLATAVIVAITPTTQADGPLTEEEALKLGTEAYVYGYPLVTMEMTRRVMTNVAKSDGKLAPMGQFAYLRTYPGARRTRKLPPPTRIPFTHWPGSMSPRSLTS